jgi:hypothetical protein
VAQVRGGVIYYDIADLHIALDCLSGPPSEPPSAVLDLNGDAVNDIIFSAGLWLSSEPDIPDFEITYVSMPGANRVVGGDVAVMFLTNGHFIASGLSPPLQWLEDTDIEMHRGVYDFTNPVPCNIDFFGAEGLMGIEFEISGNTHYGWLRLTLHPDTGAAILRDYAYESEPGVGIIAGAIPEPSTILLLSLGALGILWRKSRMDRGARTRC